MNLAIVSESSADEAALRRLLVPLVGVTSAADTSLAPIRSHGWSSVLKLLPAVINRVHYHTLVDALIVVVDSDDSVPHGAHPATDPVDCRLCRIQTVLDTEVARLTAIPGRARLRTAAGLCIPAIEAWYVCGLDPGVTEAAWILGRNTGRLPYTRRELKQRAYGTALPTLDSQTRAAVAHAERLAGDLTLLRTWFPNGCGSMLSTVASWTTS